MSDDRKFPSQVAGRLQIRMPDGLRDRIRDAAERNGRSMNTEIVSRLKDGFIERSEIQKTADNIVYSDFNMIEMVKAFSILFKNINDNPEFCKIFLEMAHQSQSRKQDDKPK